VWWTLSEQAAGALAGAGVDLGGAAHAAEHASIGLLPLFATCDRWDIGGVSAARHPATGKLTVFVYDGHDGGAGFAERGFGAAADWLRATRQATIRCPSAERSPCWIRCWPARGCLTGSRLTGSRLTGEPAEAELAHAG